MQLISDVKRKTKLSSINNKKAKAFTGVWNCFVNLAWEIV